MILHIDLSTGASGDKLLGALLEICEKLDLMTLKELEGKAQALLPEVTLGRKPLIKKEIVGNHLTVNFKNEPIEDLGLASHGGHEHTHSHWSDIQELINSAAIKGIVSTSAAERALRVFMRVATAEAKVHGTTLEEVHFHEVGAADSIIDILFNSYLFDLLNPSAVYATPLALGSGTFICAHGELPVPAPATAEILNGSGVPVYGSSHEGELTTPTGAALVAEFVTAFAPLPCGIPLAVGYGAGSRDIAGAANITRILCCNEAPLGSVEAQENEGLFVEGVVLLECNLDHLSAENIAFACEELLLEGAVDVWQESIAMKKGRLASKLSLLAKPAEATDLTRKVVELTGTLGVRSSYMERAYVARTTVSIDTPYGAVVFKQASLGTGNESQTWLRPEHDEVARLARKLDLNYSDVYEELQRVAEAHVATNSAD